MAERGTGLLFGVSRRLVLNTSKLVFMTCKCTMLYLFSRALIGFMFMQEFCGAVAHW